MASKYIQKFPVPQNFPEILHDLSKEILRNQPEDIIEFCALYFKCVQEGLVMDYHKKGKNIPCDFKPSIPKISTNQMTRKNITAEDEKAHKIAVQYSSHIDDAAQRAKIKEENKNKSNNNTKKQDDLNFVVHHVDNVNEDRENSHLSNVEKNSLIKSITTEFVDDVMSKMNH